MVSTTAAAAATTLLLVYLEIKVGCGRLRLTSSNCTSVRCKDLGDICCTSRGIAHFVLNFVAMATRVGRGKIQLAAFDGLFSKTPTQMQKISQISLAQTELYPFLSRISLSWQRVSVGKNAIGNIRWPINENPPIGAKISQKNFTQAE